MKMSKDGWQKMVGYPIDGNHSRPEEGISVNYQLIREQRTSSLVTKSFDTTFTYDPTGNRL